LNEVRSKVNESSPILVIPGILGQHVEDACFLWLLRDEAVNTPHFNVKDLAQLDGRVEAHIDGLRIAGDDGWQLCRKELDWKEAGEVFAAAVLAFENGADDRIAEVLKIGAATPELSRGIVSALGWLNYEQAAPHIKNLCASDSPARRRIGIAASAFHRKDPGRSLQDAMSDPDSLLKPRALRAVGELGRMDLVPLMQNELTAKDESCRFWAAWSITLLVGYRNAVQVLQSFAESTGPYRERALQLALRRLDINSARTWCKRLAKNPKSVRMAVIGAGVIGDPVLIPWLIEQMSVSPLSRVAGEAFTMITGVDLAYEDLDGEKPEGFESGPNDDPNDENVEMDEDERLPWPDAALIANWWAEHSGEFQDGARYLLGKPITMEWMRQVLRIGRQRQRAAAALELAIMHHGEPLFEVRAPGFRQQELVRVSAVS
jgi:uncharacterized protein (TIGR02270 family)